MNTELKQLLLAYITKSASASEIAWVKTWIAASEENEAAFIQVYEDYHRHLSAQHPLIDTNKAYQRFLAEQTVIGNKVKPISTLLRYAAVLVVFIALGLFFRKQLSPNKERLLTTIEVAKGEKSKMTLADGTIVYLNAGSVLKFDKSFNKSNRNVFLDGEAYFDIAKSKKNIPFIVDAGGYIVRDIGTVFKIKSYSEDQDFEFSVISGEISVENKNIKLDKVHLVQNQSLKINTQKQAEPTAKKPLVQKMKVEKLANAVVHADEYYDEWLSGTLTFDNTNFAEVVHTLERQYGVKISIADPSLRNYHYSGAFKNVTDPYVILDVIKQTTPISYTNVGKDIVIKSNNPKF